MVVISVMCIEKEGELKEDVPFRGKYPAPRWILYFEERIAHRDGYYYRGLCRAPHAWTNMSTWVPDLETTSVYR